MGLVIDTSALIAVERRAAGPRGADAWAWITEHWDEANARFPSNSISRMLGGIRALDDGTLADGI